MDVLNIRLGKIFNIVKTKVFSFFNRAKSERKYVFLAVVLVIIAISLILPGGNAKAQNVIASGSGLILNLIAPIIYLIFYCFMYIAYAIAWIGADIINITLDPVIMNSVLNMAASKPLYQAWSIFRDIANLLFILILLLVAFGTIFQSGDYNIKKSLPKLIAVAFLINFSAMITGVIIDFTNILMFGIAKMMCTGNADSCSQDFFNALMTTADTIYRSYHIYGWDGVISFDFKNSAAIAIASIYLFVYGLVLMALGVFFLVRIAAFALLIVLAPLAFFGEVVNSLKGVSSKWWDNLWQYAFFGPIAMLLLYVAGLMAQNTVVVPTAVFEVNPEMSYLQRDISLIISNIIPLIFLYAIIPITRSMGIAGANAVMNNTVGLAGKVGSFAKSYVTDSADRWLARGAQDQRTSIRGKLNRARAFLSPTVIKKAYKAHTAEQERDYDMAVGSVRERMDRGVKQWERSPIDRRREAYERSVDAAKKDILSENPKELAADMKEALDRGMIARADAIARKLSASGDVNEVMALYKDAAGNNMYGNTPEGFIKFMKEKFETKLGTQQTAILMSDIAQAEKKDGNHSFKGSSNYDPDKKQWTIQDATAINVATGYHKHEEAAASEFGKVEPRAKWRGLDKRTLLDQDATGTWNLAERGEMILDKMTAADFKNVKNGKADHLKQIYEVLSRPGFIAAMPVPRRAQAAKLQSELYEAIKKA